MGIEDPGKLTVSCDECYAEIECDTAEYAGHPRSFGVDDDVIEAEGWAVDGDITYCPNCKPTEEEE